MVTLKYGEQRRHRSAKFHPEMGISKMLNRHSRSCFSAHDRCSPTATHLGGSWRVQWQWPQETPQ